MSLKSKAGHIVQIALWFLPAKIGNALRRRLLGWELGQDVRIGLSLIDAKRVVLHEGSSVGHFTFARNLEVFEVGRYSKIGNFNQIAGRPQGSPEYNSSIMRSSIFRIGIESAVTHRHYFDCTHVIDIGDFVTIAGGGSQFWSHGIDIGECRQTAEPIIIGNYCMLGTGLIVLKGVTVGDCCVIAAGSVVTRSLDGYQLAAGVPAKAIKALDPETPYFTRVTGAIL